MKPSAFYLACAFALFGANTSAMAQTDTRAMTVNGEIVQYEPGKVIVIRGSDNTERTYTLNSSATMSNDIQVGQEATVYLEPSPEGGATMVKRVATTSVTPSGRTKRTVEETRTEPSGATSTITTTTKSARVEAYTAGKSITVLEPNGTRETYVINPDSTVPADVNVGRTITIVPASPGEHVVRSISIE